MSVNRTSGFFRQSSWMVIATFAGGFFMALVHTVAGHMGRGEYSTFVSLLRLLIIMGIPSAALQTIFARQAATVNNRADEQHLIATTRAILGALVVIWIVSGIALLCALRPISHLLKVSNPLALYFTIGLGFTGLPIPVMKGLLQGQHRFAGLGWLQITDGVGRFTIMLIVIYALKGKAAGAMGAALVGQLLTLAIAAALTRGSWAVRPSVSFQWKQWLAEALPLTAGLGTVLLMSSIDMLFVQSLFTDPSQTALYGGAMLTGFAIVQFIAPVSLVMFARVARSVAREERSDSLGMTLAATVLFGCLAGIGSTLFPRLPLRLMYFTNRAMWAASPLVPWFAWALLPVTVANVLVQNILARSRFRVIPWLVLVPALYAAALCWQAPALLQMPVFAAFVRVIQTLGLSALLLCAMAAWFSRVPAPDASDPDAPAPAISRKASSPVE
jgi:O-antigen/teichoic acid export membrane protein